MTALGPVRGVRLAGAGSAWPSDLADPTVTVLDGAAVARRLLGPGWRRELERRGWSEDHAERAWGVARREWTRDTDVTVVDLARAAAERALAGAGRSAQDVDVLVVGTCTPPFATAAVSARVARALGSAASTFDVRAGGTSGLAAWTAAALWIGAGARVALAIGAETPSPWLAPDDLANAWIFGDGAAALCLVADADADRGLLGARAGGRAGDGRAFTVPGPLPPTEEALRAGRYRFRSPDAGYIVSLEGAREDALAALAELVAEHGGRVDAFLPYAVTRPGVEAAAERLAVGPGVTRSVLARRGAPGSAGPLAALAEALPSLSAGDSVATCAAGGGIAWQSVLWRV